MAVSIWKYPLAITDIQYIEMPLGAEILHVGVQDEVLVVWAIVSPDAEPVRREFKVYGTGHAIVLDDEEHIGTVQMASGLVWHVFDRGEQQDG